MAVSGTTANIHNKLPLEDLFTYAVQLVTRLRIASVLFPAVDVVERICDKFFAH